MLRERIRVLFVLTFVLVCALILAFVFEPSGQASSHLKYHRNAVYVAPADDLPVPMEAFEQLGVTIVSAYSDLIAWESQGNEVSIIYLHPDVLNAVDEQHLRTALRQGVVIAALNTPVSALSETLGTAISYEDLPSKYYSSDQYVTAAMILHIEQPEEGTTRQWTYYDFFLSERFQDIPRLIESQLHYHYEEQAQASSISGSCPAPGGISLILKPIIGVLKRAP